MTQEGQPDDSWDSLGEVPSGDDLGIRDLRDFVLHLQEDKIHPVLIFGTHGAGKSLMLLSLLHYARQSATANMRIRLGESVFPDHFPYATERHADAEQFYQTLTVEFARGDRPPSTQKIVPFFIPVTVEVGGRSYKLAFLEGNGEWYERDEFNSFRQFKQEIAGILSGSAEPLSAIFVAPTSDERSRRDRNFRNASHEALAHCVEQYTRHRIAPDRDNLLLLVTKWDALHNPSRTDRHFSDASVSDLLAEIEPWQFIWQEFGNLAGPRRAVLPYAACWLHEGGMMVRDPLFEPIFDKYNRTIWNWLIGNASEALSTARPSVREIIYPDVCMPKPASPTFYQKLIKASLWL